MAGTASELIDEMIAGLDDWRGPVLAKLRAVILAADPGIVEEWKWMGSPTWSCDGPIVVGNPHKGKIKLTFAHGGAVGPARPIQRQGYRTHAAVHRYFRERGSGRKGAAGPRAGGHRL